MSEVPLVVVGVDGSDCSLEALQFAVEEANYRGASLRIVSAWSVPAVAYAGGSAVGLDPALFREAAEAASKVAADEARRTGGDLVIDAVVTEMPATTALLESAKDADLLVVGSRGHGVFASLLLGSVSTQLAQHARCPIAIIHSRESV